MKLQDKVGKIKGVGDKKATLLKNLKIEKKRKITKVRIRKNNKGDIKYGNSIFYTRIN